MPTTTEFIPPASEALELPVDDLALRLLRYFGACEAVSEHSPLNHHNILLLGSWSGHEIRGSELAPFFRAISEAWGWLMSHGLLAQRPDQGEGWVFITRRGHSVLETDSLNRLRAEERINVDLHPRLGPRIRRQFLLGEHELAAFAAMKEVEVAVREAASASDSVIGVHLMKQAYGKEGTLRDKELDPGEQEAIMALYWGSIGVFKNPTSHRPVEFNDPTLASEIVLLADLLLRLLDETKRTVNVASATGVSPD